MTRALAESFRAELMSAARAGGASDEVTGLPESRSLGAVVTPRRGLRGYQVAAGGTEVPEIHRRGVDDGDHGAAAPPPWPARRCPHPPGIVRSVLDALTVRLDSKPAAATSVYRKRAVFYNALGLAVERRLLLSEPR